MLFVAWLAIAALITLVAGVFWLMAHRRASDLFNTARFTVRELEGIPLDGDVEVWADSGPSPSGPIAGPLSRQQGIWTHSVITEHWETTRTYTDSEGNMKTETEHHSRTLYDNKSVAPILMTDETGSVWLMPESISFEEIPKVVSDYDNPGLAYTVIGHLNLHFGARVECEEWVLPSGGKLFALCQVGQDDKGIRFLHAAKGHRRPFARPSDNPEQVEQDVRKSITLRRSIALVGVALLLLLGATLAISSSSRSEFQQVFQTDVTSDIQ